MAARTEDLFCYNDWVMLRLLFLLVVIGYLFAVPSNAQAIPPPDFIVNFGSQLAQIFALLIVLFSAAAGIILQYFRVIFAKIRARKLLVGALALAVVVVSLTSALYIEQHRITVEQIDYEHEVAATIESGIEANDAIADPAAGEVSSFFEDQQNLPLAISNADFAVAELADHFVLDAREDEEYEIGYYPGSTHLRFADLLAGDWQQLPTDRVVYVFCWSGIRGSELAEFLREKGIVARYLEDGAKGWYDAGGTWQGGILFSSKYPEERYTGTLTTEQVKNYVAGGAVLVDARQPEVFDLSHIDGSVNISIFFTPTTELATLFDQVPNQSTVITVCDDYVSCFDAKIAGVKLEKLGHTFLGRYASPQEY